MTTPRFSHVLELYVGKKKEHRWRIRARNGKIIADSGEGYKRRAAMMKSYRAFVVAILDGDIDIKDFAK